MDEVNPAPGLNSKLRANISKAQSKRKGIIIKTYLK